MKRIVITYGLISGAIIAVMMLITTTFREQIGFENGAKFGWATIILGASMIYFAIASYKKNNGGKISFGKAFRIGVLVSLIASAVYGLVWVVLLNTIMPNFCDEYGKYMLDSMHKSGKSEQEIAKAMEEVKSMSVMMKNPVRLFLIGMFVECFPAGLLVSLISSLILSMRNEK